VIIWNGKSEAFVANFSCISKWDQQFYIDVKCENMIRNIH